MSSKRYDGQNFIDTSIQKRYDGSNWVDISSAKRFDGSNWIETLAIPQEFAYSSGLSSNVSTFKITKDSSTTVTWKMTLSNSTYWTYAYIVATGLFLTKGDIVTIKARNVYSMQYYVSVKWQSSSSDTNAVEIGLGFQEYTFTAPSSNALPCFKITRGYNGYSTPQGTLEVEYMKINGKMYKPNFIER